ncbi:hypothetical protein HYT55_04920 [Candidatus Woesearchaeota archaeon]|nr:hypothetical protein [Candidatus Woesearchaeota archaeon]
MKPEAVERYQGQLVYLDLGRTGYVGVVHQVYAHENTVVIDPAQHLGLDERTTSLVRLKLVGRSLDPKQSVRAELDLDAIVGISTLGEKED